MSTEDKTILINTKHLEKATIFVNTHNDSIKDALTQNEVINFILSSWKDEEYKSVLRYKGIIIIPELIQTGNEFTTVAVITVHPDFSSDFEDYEEISL